MKTLFIFGFLLGLIAQTSFGDPMTFDEFKKLPPKEQEKMVANIMDDASNPAHEQLFRWWWRVQVGEEAWQQKEQERLIDQRGYTELKLFFQEYQILTQQFLPQEWVRMKKSGMSAQELAYEGARFDEREKTSVDLYPEAIRLLSTLAPTKEVILLNKQAGDLINVWFKRFPDGTSWVITREDMAAIDGSEQAIMDQLKRLPKLTPEEVQAAIDALPKDYPGTHAIRLPHK